MTLINFEIMKLFIMVTGVHGMSRPHRRRTASKRGVADASCGRNLTGLQTECYTKTVGSEVPPSDLPLQVEEWKAKELRSYQESQDKKWRNWAKAVFR